jgi:hypothetical protein
MKVHIETKEDTNYYKCYWFHRLNVQHVFL